MKRMIFVIILNFIFIWGCSDSDNINGPNVESRGEIKLQLPKTSIPDGVSSILVKLTRDEFTDIVNEYTVDQTKDLTIIIDEIPTGLWTIDIKAMNINGDVLYSGSSSISVLQDILTEVSVNMSRENNDETGSVLINLNWGNNEWVDYENNPILEGSSSDAYGIYQAVVLKNNGHYMMWYNGLTHRSESNVYLANSVDGYNWQKYSEVPVLSPGKAGAWDSKHVSAHCVVKDSDFYKMYYVGWEDQFGKWKVGLATSSDGINWQKNDEPILVGNGWDKEISAVSVVKVGSVYHMYYEGRSEVHEAQIGIARSSDGYSWEKGPYPLMSATEDWEGNGVGYPSVLYENGAFTMIYNGRSNGSVNFGEAKSKDGINWIKSGYNPIFTNHDSNFGWTKVAYPFYTKIADKYAIYYSGYDMNSNQWKICLAVKN